MDLINDDGCHATPTDTNSSSGSGKSAHFHANKKLRESEAQSKKVQESKRLANGERMRRMKANQFDAPQRVNQSTQFITLLMNLPLMK